MAKTTMVPALALAMTPFTELFGPIFSYNVINVASPALSAFTAYLLCRRLATRELPAVVGGLLFGFSSYEFGQLLGHLNLVPIFLIPVMVHLSLRRVDREISRRAYMLWLTVLLALQMGLSTELLAEIVMLGFVLLVCARFLAGEPHRGRVTGLIGETIAAGVVTAILISPFLYYASISGGFPPAQPLIANMWGLDLANLLFPTETTLFGHSQFQPLWMTFEHANVSESSGYVSLPILLAFGTWFFGGGRRTTLGKMLVITIAISVVMAIGGHLHVAGIETIPMPFDVIRKLPIFDNLVPSRIMLYATLAIAIGLAVWLAQRDGHTYRRWAVALIGIVMLTPNIAQALYGVPPNNPMFFKTTMYRHYLTRNETVLVLPFGPWDASTLWQAETGFYYYMPEGYVSSVIPPEFAAQPGLSDLWLNRPPVPAELRAFIRMHYVSDVIVDARKAGPWPELLANIGLKNRKVIGGVMLYPVP